jgi:hypothetical protein
MASTPSTINSMSREASANPSELPSTLLGAFSQMMQQQPVVQKKEVRDRCRRPSPTYNFNYNPYEPPSDDLPMGYSPYVFREPLYDDREVIVSRLPQQHTLCSAQKRRRTQWVWKVGYALTDESRAEKPTIWACKRCKFFLIK